MTRQTRLLQWIGLAGIALFLVAGFTPFPNAMFRWSAAVSDIQPADAIVVLGAAVEKDGTLSCESLARTAQAVALYRKACSSTAGGRPGRRGGIAAFGLIARNGGPSRR